MGRLLVVGSLNVDHVVRVDALPGPGETVLGTAYGRYMGGKGANQAVAAARLGADVVMVGAVGADAAGDDCIDALTADGVDCRFVARVAGTATGAAVIVVDRHGENQIAVAPGANLAVSPEAASVTVRETQPQAVAAVLEVPMSAVVAGAQAAASFGAAIIVNPAPAGALPEELLATHPVLTPNQHELAMTADLAADVPVPVAAHALVARGALAVLVTRGADGLMVVTSEGLTSFPAERPGPVLDTTGAGDAFAGAVAAFLAEGMDLLEAARLANAAAGLAVLQEGARGSMPTRTELDAYLKRHPVKGARAEARS
jgi:ribokinase